MDGRRKPVAALSRYRLPGAQAVQDRLPVHHARVAHQAIDDDRLDEYDIRVLLAIARFANWQHGTCWPGLAAISKKARIKDKKHRPTIAAIRHLEELGYLTVQRRTGNPNIYALTLPPSTGGGVRTEPPPIDGTTTPSTGGYPPPPPSGGGTTMSGERVKKRPAIAGRFGPDPTPEQVQKLRDALRRRSGRRGTGPD